MGFKRQWDETCPKVWDSWEKDGAQWWIQDLPPEDDELAVDLLAQNFIPDDTICTSTGVSKDPISTKSLCYVWQQCIKHRMTLACYTYVNGKKTLAGLNVVIVKCKGEEENYEAAQIKGAPMHDLMKTLNFIESTVDVFKYYGIDRVLYAMGLVVKREFRGEKLGVRILDAREPLCKFFEINATSTIFTGPASQKLASMCGFETLAAVTLKQLAEIGLKYPKDANRVMKLMAKKYN